jgi:putative ABC transport system permease protein
MEKQLDQELDFHLEQHASELIARGIAPAEARRQARMALGGPEQMKEECRDARGTLWLDDLWQDFYFALRSLRQRPGFAIVAVITLALGIGASTAIFSAVNPILFQSLPYPRAGQIMMIWEMRKDGDYNSPSFAMYRKLGERTRSFESLAVMQRWRPTMTGAAEPERLNGQHVSADYFRVLGVKPAIGRDFESSDDRYRGPKVVILSNVLWHQRLGGDHAIVGRQITLDDTTYTIVGVMPAGFDNVLAPSAGIWSPQQFDASLPPQGQEWAHNVSLAGRLRPGIGRDQGRRESDAILRALATELPPSYGVPAGLAVNSLQNDVTGGIRPALLAVLGAVVLVLLIACVNVMNLLLARGAQRQSEFAMRAALGAGRMRVIRQLLTESLVLAVLGGALGMLIAQNGIAALIALGPSELPRANAIGISGAVFAFALGVTSLVGILIGLVPALRAYQGDLNIALRGSGRSTVGSHQRTRRTLVVAEVALALVLLISAGLLLRSFERLFSVAPGFTESGLFTMQVQAKSGLRFADDNATRRFFSQALAAASQVPGVTAAAFTSLLPLSGDSDEYGAHFPALPSGQPAESLSVYRYGVSPGYFETMRIPLRRGRFLNARDSGSAPAAVVISESLARHRFGNTDPVGQQLGLGPEAASANTIVGVVGDVRQTSLASGQADAVYSAAAQGWFADSVMTLVFRAQGDASSLVPSLKKAIWSVDKDQPITRIASMDTLAAGLEARRHFALIVFEAFALAALVLAATGIYGVLSGNVNERMREIGLRSALGASRGDIIAMVVRQAMTLTGFGVLAGIAGAVAASRALVTLLFGISRLDPVTYLGVIALLSAVAMVACWVPAARAARVDPNVTLRME